MSIFSRNKTPNTSEYVELARKVAVVVFARKYGWITRSKSNKKSVSRMSGLDADLNEALSKAFSSTDVSKEIKSIETEYQTAIGGGSVSD